MDDADTAPISLDYFNKNAYKQQFIGLKEYAGVFPSGTTDPTNIVSDYNAATDQTLNGGEVFIRFFDSAIGGSPEI